MPVHLSCRYQPTSASFCQPVFVDRSCEALRACEALRDDELIFQGIFRLPVGTGIAMVGALSCFGMWKDIQKNGPSTTRVIQSVASVALTILGVAFAVYPVSDNCSRCGLLP